MMDKMEFRDKVYKAVRKIPRGKVMVYSEIARKAGNLKAWRAVGHLLAKNRNPEIPCHRVIRLDGKIGGYNRGTKKKIELLKKEGLKIKNGKIRSKFIQ